MEQVFQKTQFCLLKVGISLHNQRVNTKNMANIDHYRGGEMRRM